MPNRILDRILRKTSGRDLLGALTDDLSPTDLQSLLLEVYRIRAKRLTPADIPDQVAGERLLISGLGFERLLAAYRA